MLRALLTVVAFCMLLPVVFAQKPHVRDLSIRFEGLSAGKQKYLEGTLRTWDADMFLSISIELQEARVTTRRVIDAQELGVQLAPFGITVSQITEITDNGLHGHGVGTRCGPLSGTRSSRTELMDQATPADAGQ